MVPERVVLRPLWIPPVRIIASLKPTLCLLEPTGGVLELASIVMEPTSEVLEPTSAVLVPTGVVMESANAVLHPTGVAEPTGAVLHPKPAQGRPTAAGRSKAACRGPDAHTWSRSARFLWSQSECVSHKESVVVTR